MTAPDLKPGKNGLLTAQEVAVFLRYASADSFLEVRPRLEKNYDFPPPVKQFGRLLWRFGDIDTWLARQSGTQVGE